MALTVASAYKYLRGKCPGFSRDFVYINRTGSSYSSRFEVVVISEGKLKVIEVHTEKWALDVLVTKLSEVCRGLPYDDGEYVQPYYHVNADGEQYDTNNPVHKANPEKFNQKHLLGSVVRLRKNAGIDMIRRAHKFGQNIGIEEVDKPANALSVEEWIAQNT